MEKYDLSAYQRLITHAVVLSKDRHGDKVLRLKDGTLIKLFRVKHLISSARFYPHARRFADNAVRLHRLKISTVCVVEVFTVPAIKRSVVRYAPLAGTTLRDYLPQGQMEPAFLDALAGFFADLHQKGVYFRAIHFGNILVTAPNAFGLIDIDDIRFKRPPLSVNRRLKNFGHFLHYPTDRDAFMLFAAPFIQRYAAAGRFSPRRRRRLIQGFAAAAGYRPFMEAQG